MKSESYQLFYVPNWASLAIRLTLEDHGIPYEATLLKPAEDLNSDWYRQVNPHALVPAMKTSSGPIFETGAILLWLSERHEGLCPPVGAPERASFLSWLFFVANTVHPTVMRLINPDKIAGEEHVPVIMAGARQNLRGQFSKLEALAAHEHRWFSGTGPILLVGYVAMLMRFAASDTPDPAYSVTPSEYPALRTMFKSIEQRPSVQRIAADEGLGARPFSDP